MVMYTVAYLPHLVVPGKKKKIVHLIDQHTAGRQQRPAQPKGRMDRRKEKKNHAPAARRAAPRVWCVVCVYDLDKATPKRAIPQTQMERPFPSRNEQHLQDQPRTMVVGVSKRVAFFRDHATPHATSLASPAQTNWPGTPR